MPAVLMRRTSKGPGSVGGMRRDGTGRVDGGGFCGWSLALAMEACLRAVLLWTRRRDPLMHDAELQPPRVQARVLANGQ